MQRLLENVYIRFLLAGALNTVFGYALFLVILATGWPLVVVVALSNIGGVAFNFWTSSSLVFKDRDPRKIIRFCLAWCVQLLIGYVALLGVISLGVPVFAAPLVTLPPMVCISFVMSRYVVFKQPRRDVDAPSR